MSRRLTQAAAALAIAGLAAVIILLSLPVRQNTPKARLLDAEITPDSESRANSLTLPPPLRPRTISDSDDLAAPASRGVVTAPAAISGVVLDIDGNPAQDASVAIFDAVGGIPDRRSSVSVVTDSNGRFRLPASTWSVGYLVAYKEGRRPGMLPLPAPRAAVLSLGEGSRVQGTVRIDGVPVAGASVSADVRYGVPGWFDGLTELWWETGAFEMKHASTSTDDAGGFTLRGLALGSHRVSACGLSPNERWIMGDVSIEIVAPASGVELGAEMGRLRIGILGAGGPIAGAQLAITDPSGGTLRSAVSEPFFVRVRTGMPLTIEAAALGFAPVEVSVPPLMARENREVDVVLTSIDGPDLHLTLHGATENSIQAVSLRFIPMQRRNGKESNATNDLRSRLRATRSNGDVFRARLPYPPGRYVLVVLPDPPDSWLLPTQIEIELPERGIATASLDAISAGRLDVRVLDPAGERAEGRWTLFDAGRREVLSGTSHARAGMWAGGRGFAAAAMEADWLRRDTGLLAPGTYSLEASGDGFLTAQCRVTIIAGSTAHETVRLEREALK